MTARRRRKPSMIAMPSQKSTRRQRPAWDNGHDSTLEDDFEDDFFEQYGSILSNSSGVLPSNDNTGRRALGRGELTSNNTQWGLRDVRVERSLQISPPIVNFGSVQRGAVSRKTIRLHNCTGHIARARIVPFKAFSLLETTENFLKSEPNVARMSAGLSTYITITCVGRGLGKITETLQVYVSEHDLVYEIPIVGEVLAEKGFTEACRRQELAKKMKELEIDLLETTHDGDFAQLIPSSELTVGYHDNTELADQQDTKQRKKSLGGLVASYKANNDPLETTNAEVPTFPNVRWNTFTNSLRIDNRKKWKIEPDTSVSVDVIKKRYKNMVTKSTSKWANVEDRFHVAKMLSRVAGLTPRTNVFSAARKMQKTAAVIAFGTEESEQRASGGGGGDDGGGGNATLNTNTTTTQLNDGQAPTVDMSAAQRKAADRETENKLLGQLGIEKSVENPEDV
jgi:hypothetical protein